MALRYAERVKESTNNKPANAGTAFSLGGARTGFRSFVAAIGNGNRCVACAQKIDGNGNPAGAWQVFIGTVTDAPVDMLSQDHLISSSTGGFIDWSASGENSAPDVFVIHPAAQSIQTPHMKGRWLTTLWNYTLEGGFFQVNRLLAFPIVVPEPCLLTGLRFEVTGTSSGAKAVLGIYDDLGGYPGTKLDQSSAEHDCSTTGVKTYVPGGAGTFIRPGRAWIVWMSNNNMASYRGLGASNPGIGVSSHLYGAGNATFTLNDGCLEKDHAYSATMPATFPAGGASRNNNFPMLQYRLDFF
jgi:hypothetical protein